MPATTPHGEIVAHRGLDGLQRLAADWSRLYGELPFRSGFHSFEATQAYVRHLSPSPETFTCFALTDGHAIRAICPLEQSTQWLLGGHVRVWRLPRHGHWPISDAICPDGETARQLVQGLVEHLSAYPNSPSVLELGPLPEYSTLREGLTVLPAQRYCTLLKWRSSIIDCARSFEDIESSMSKNGRKDMRKAYRRLAEVEGVALVNATIPEDTARELESFLKVEASGWKGEKGEGTAISCDPGLVSYYRDLVEAMSATGECALVTLYVGSACIAAQLVLKGTDESIALKSGYDETRARLMPGKLVIEAMARVCCDNPDTRRINLITETEWLHSWGTPTVPVMQSHVALKGVRGRVYLALFRLQRSIRAAVLRRRKRRVDRASAPISR